MVNKIKLKDVNGIKMSVNPPKCIVDADYRVIFNGRIKCYVGIGWVDEGKAKLSDYNKIPEVIERKGIIQIRGNFTYVSSNFH